MSSVPLSMTFKITHVIRPGFVRSKKDGQKYFVSSVAILRHYGLSPDQCIVEQPWMRDRFKDLPHVGPVLSDEFEEVDE